MLAGAASLLLVVLAFDPANRPLLHALTTAVLGSLLFTFGVVAAELYTPHANKDVATAAEWLKRGPAAGRFWWGYALLGTAVPVLVFFGIFMGALPLGAGALAAVCALAGLWVYEDIWIRAGQSVAMS